MPTRCSAGRGVSILAWCVALLCAAALGACGGNGAGGNSTAGGNATASGNPTAGGDSTTASQAGPDLQKALPTVREMPSEYGFTERDVAGPAQIAKEEAQAGEFLRGCKPLDDAGDAFEPVDQAQATFPGENLSPTVIVAVYRTSGPDQAADIMTRFERAYKACDEWRGKDDEGKPATYGSNPVTAPDLGDGTYAVKVSMQSDISLNIHDIAVRRGAILIDVAAVGVAPKTSLTAETARRTLEKLDAQL